MISSDYTRRAAPLGTATRERPRAAPSPSHVASDLPRSSSRLALIVSSDDWCGDALESVLEPGGYRVVRVPGDGPTLDVVVGAAPDVILVAAEPPQTDVIELCRRLRHEASTTAGTGIVLVVAGPTTVAQRVAGLRAGAWDVLSLPMNADELLAKLDACVSVKQETDRMRADGLLDSASGLYAVRGMEYRSRELLADASRRHLPLACVVLSADPEFEDEPDGEREPVASARAIQHVAKLLHTHGRLSDVIGRWNDTEFAVLAPGTDAAGAARLAERLSQVVDDSPPPSGAFTSRLALRAGYEAVDDAGASHLRAADLLARANTAFQRARTETSLPRIRRYTPDIRHPDLP